MKWFVALGALVVGGLVFSPVVGLLLAILAALIAPQWLRLQGASSPDAASAAGRGRSVDDELVSLRTQVSRLERRLATVERDMATLTAGGVVSAAVAAPAAESPPIPAAVALVPSQPMVLSEAVALPVEAMAEVPVGPVVSEPVPVLDTAAEPEPQPQPDPISIPVVVKAPVVIAPPVLPPRVPERLPVPPPKTLAERLPEPLRAFIFGGNTLVKVGVLLLFLGLAFLLRYAAERVTVPLPLRYAGVMGVGVALLAIGWRLRDKRASYALTLQGAGIGVFYLTILAAMKLHALIPPAAGFAFLFGVAVLSAVLAVLQNALVLAVVAALEGFAAPVLVSTGSDNPLGLFVYLLALNVGIFVVAWFKAWRPLHLIGLVGTITLAGGWAQGRYTPEYFALTQTFLIVFGVMFSLIGLLFARRTLQEGGDETWTQGSLAERAARTLQRVGRVDSALVFGAPLSAYGLQYLLVQDKPMGPALAAVAFGLFELVLARLALAQRHAGLSLLAESYVVVAVLFATLAIPLGLEGRWTGAAWAVEAAGMFWLGLRQQRPYARVFALLVMGGATFKLLQELTLSFGPDTPWLSGSSLGPLMLAGAAATIWSLQRRTLASAEPSEHRAASRLSVVEDRGVQAMPWWVGGALHLLPWLWFMPSRAPMGATVLAVVFWLLSERLTRTAVSASPEREPERTPLAAVSAALHGAAVLGLLSTLHRGDAQSILANDHSALLTTLWVAVGLLATVWRAARLARVAARMEGPLVWTTAQQVAVLGATVLLHLAPLFLMDGHGVAWLWPMMATLTLWAALRLGLTPLALLAAIVQWVAIGLHLRSELGWDVSLVADVPPFLNRGFLTSMVQVLAWLISAGLLHAASRRASADRNGAAVAAVPTVLSSPQVLWATLGVGVIGWLVTWLDAFRAALITWDRGSWQIGTMVLVLLVSGLLARGVARVRQWPHMALTSLAVLPMVAAVAVLDIVTGSTPPMPLHDLGLLAWPLALVWHGWSLRRWPLEASLGGMRRATHVGGLWLFTALATLELVARVQALMLPGAAWQTLSNVVVIAAVLAALSRPRAAERWPLSEDLQAYLVVGALPLAALSGLWLLGAGLVSAGDAAPLPYLPLLNPLELGLAGVVLTLWQWQRALPPTSRWRLAAERRMPLMAGVGLGLLTGMVLRACHHWADVAWTPEALFASRLTQAALSLAWAACAVMAMVLGNRRLSRNAWVAGAVLLGVVVAKLFFVELADHGGIYRIVSFIGVGVLLLLVGYFAPVPGGKPAGHATESAS